MSHSSVPMGTLADTVVDAGRKFCDADGALTPSGRICHRLVSVVLTSRREQPVIELPHHLLTSGKCRTLGAGSTLGDCSRPHVGRLGGLVRPHRSHTIAGGNQLERLRGLLGATTEADDPALQPDLGDAIASHTVALEPVSVSTDAATVRGLPDGSHGMPWEHQPAAVVVGDHVPAAYGHDVRIPAHAASFLQRSTPLPSLRYASGHRRCPHPSPSSLSTQLATHPWLSPVCADFASAVLM